MQLPIQGHLKMSKIPHFRLNSNPAQCIGKRIKCHFPGCETTFTMNSPTHRYCARHSTSDVYAIWLPRNWPEIEARIEEGHIQKLNTKVFTAVEHGGTYTQEELRKLIPQCGK